MASLTRQFSSETYDKMLANPNMSAEQRNALILMRDKRRARSFAPLPY